MIKIKSFLKHVALIALVSVPSAAMAQNAVAPQNGQLVRLDRNQFWAMKDGRAFNIGDAVKIGTGLHSPAVSPDGSQVILYERPKEAMLPGHLHAWQQDRPALKMIHESVDASEFVTWTSNDQFFMRENSAPFFKHGQKLKFSATKHVSPVTRGRAPIQENAVVVYDDNDVIVMIRNGVTQAISDITIDRYSGPQVSSNEKFVVFSGLKTGLNLFDIEQNAVVYQDARGAFARFSPDGRYLVYSKLADDGHAFTKGDIVVIDLAAKQRHFVANPKGEVRIRATISNDAKFIAWENVQEETYRARLNP